MNKLRIGVISYANLFPIIHTLRNRFDCSSYEFVEGVPSDLNRKIRTGQIDISPSSSVEYLRNREQYRLIEGHSISSQGPVKSIILFSRYDIASLDGRTVLTSSQSETSVVMLRIILERFYGIKPGFKQTSKSLAEAMKISDAYMAIGDEALYGATQWNNLFKYDIGELWYSNTGVPAVFALWIARRGCCIDNPDLFERLLGDLNAAKKIALSSLPLIAASSLLREVLSEDELVAYWQSISYDFGDKERAGLELFGKYAELLGLL